MARQLCGHETEEGFYDTSHTIKPHITKPHSGAEVGGGEQTTGVEKTTFFCPQDFECMTKLFFVVILGQSKDVIFVFDVFLSCFCY